MKILFLQLLVIIPAAACWWLLRARKAYFFILLRHFFLAFAIVGIASIFDGKFDLKLQAAAAAGIVFLVFGPIIFIRHKIRQGIDYVKNDGDGTNSHIRGARLVSGKQLYKILKKEKGSITLGEQKIPERLEALHFLIAGATGVGKSVAISEMLDGISTRGDRVFLSDAGGNFLKHYYNPSRGDLILNPLDERAISWSPLAEMEGEWDADQIASSIIPEADGSSKEWNQYAQVTVAAILKHCWQNGLNNAEIFRLAIIAEIKELRSVFAGTPAQALVAEGNEKMFGSVRGIVGTYLSPFQYLAPAAGVDSLSLKRFAQSDNEKGWLFYNFRDDQLQTLKPLIACVADIISKAILSTDSSNERKFWLILDEFASLGRVASILDFLTKARKNGGRAVIGVQTVSQLRAAYGHSDAGTLLSCLSSQLVFRVPDPETADLMSRMLGEEQISRVIQSGGESQQSMQFGGSKSDNWSQQITTERVILPSQLQKLESLNAILNLAGGIPAAPVLLEPQNRAVVTETFTPAPRRKPAVNPVAIAAADEDNVSDDDLPIPAPAADLL